MADHGNGNGRAARRSSHLFEMEFGINGPNDRSRKRAPVVANYSGRLLRTCRAWLFVLSVAIVAPIMLASHEASAVVATESVQPPELLKGKAKGNWAKTSRALRVVVSEFRTYRKSGGAPELFKPSNSSLLYVPGRILIKAVAAGDANVLFKDLQKLGLQKASRYGAVVTGLIPIGAISKTIELKSLGSITASFKPILNTGSVDGQGGISMNADMSPASGFDGTGSTIGVLSDSYDANGGAAADISSGDLPANVNVLEDMNSGIDEGRAMMQLIYDVAPGVNLSFHTAFNGIADFANGIEALAASGANIIVDDVVYLTEPMFQDGIVAQAIDNVESQGVAYFSSAGNNARQSYEAPFVPSGEPLYRDLNGDGIPDYAGELHDFTLVGNPNTDDWSQSFEIPASSTDSTVILLFQWDEPFKSAGGSGATSDMDIYLMDSNNAIVAQSDDDNIASGDAIEMLQFKASNSCSMLELILKTCVPYGTYNLIISHFAGPEPGKMKYIIFRSDIVTDYRTDSSTSFGHANAAGAEAVGAAYYVATPFYPCDPTNEFTYDDCELNAQNVETAQLEPYSSAGGTAILFDKSGNRLASPEVRVKPGVVGPDGTNTTFFYSDSVRDADTLPNFFGTSASAPHVAAVGALMLQANPNLTPAELYGALESTALNMNPRATGSPEDPDGFDFDTGYGFVQADLAVAAALGVTPGNQPPVADAQSVTTDEDTAVAVTLTASDPDSGPGSLTYSVVSGPANGTLSGTAPNLTYTPNANFNGPDSFTFKANDGSQDSNTATVSITVNSVNDPPLAAYTAVCNGLTCDFTDGSTDVDGTVTAWSWNFGDGNSSNLQNPSHTYSAAGTYLVTLVVTDNESALSTNNAGQQVTVGAASPTTMHIANLDGTAGNSGKNWFASVTALVLDNTNQPVIGATVDGLWTGDFSGQGSCTTSSPTGTCTIISGMIPKKKTNSTIFTVTNVSGSLSYQPGDNTDPDGDSSGTAIQVNKDGTTSNPGSPPPNAAPTASFTATTNGLTADFTDTSTDSDGTITSWSWDFGDGNASTSQSPSHTYAVAGTYGVTLTVTDNDGAVSSPPASQQVTVSDGPPSGGVTVSLTSSSTNQGKTWTATVLVHVSDADGPVSSANVDYNWSDGSFGSCVTDGNGDCGLISKTGIAKKTSTVTFNVSAPSVASVVVSKP